MKKPNLIRRVLQSWLGGGSSGAPVQWGGISWDDWVRGNVDGQAQGVNEKAARSVAAVISCVNLIGGSIASMPMHLYRRGTDGEREAYKNDLWWLLNERPWPNWSAAAMWEYLAASRLFYGDAFARIYRAGKFSPVASGFEPIHPLRVTVLRDGPDLFYRIAPDVTDLGSQTVTIPADDMLHVTGPGFDGLRSQSQLQYSLRNAAGIARSADGQASQFFADGARPDWALQIEGKMSPEQAATTAKSFADRNSGQSSGRVPVILSGGVKLQQLTMSGQDAQLLETRGFQIEEICRVFGVPPFMIGHNDKTTSWGSGIEQMSLGFVKYTLQRHLVALEQEINFKLFKTSRNFAEFVTAGLERGDLKGRFEAYRIALGRAGEPGWMDANEVRRLENMPSDPKFDNQATPAPAAAGGTTT